MCRLDVCCMNASSCSELMCECCWYGDFVFGVVLLLLQSSLRIITATLPQLIAGFS
jgi:hypothetical protein